MRENPVGVCSKAVWMRADPQELILRGRVPDRDNHKWFGGGPAIGACMQRESGVSKDNGYMLADEDSPYCVWRCVQVKVMWALLAVLGHGITYEHHTGSDHAFVASLYMSEVWV
jgi:hypothetical protein